MSDQISPIKTPALSIGASVRAEHDPFVPFRKGRKAALQLAVSLWIAGGLLGVPGAAAAEEADVTISSAADAEAKATGAGAVLRKDLFNADFGAYAYSLKSGKVLQIVGGDYQRTLLAAGYADAPGATVTGHTLTVDGSTFTEALAGGLLNNAGQASHNRLVFRGGESQLIGGGCIYSDSGTAQANNNSVVMSGGTVDDVVYGGRVTKGEACGNEVLISGGRANSVVGGVGELAANNRVTISGSSRILHTVTGGTSDGGNTTGNSVTITGGTIGSDTAGIDSVYGGNVGGLGKADNNTVTITGGTIKGCIYGGFGSEGADGNTVLITGGTIGGTDCHEIYGGIATCFSASGNTVTFAGQPDTSQKPDVYGGNIISLPGEDPTRPDYTRAVIDNNTVNLLTAVTLGNLVGGHIDVIEKKHFYGSGNTLNVAATGNTAELLGGFQKLNFYLPADTAAGSTMLTVADTAYVDNAKVGLQAQGIFTGLAPSDTVTLLQAGSFNGTLPTGPVTTKPIPTGITTVKSYDFTLSRTGNALTATLGKVNDYTTAELQDNTKSMVETRAASTTMLNGGTDLLAGQGFQQAANAAAQAESADARGTARSLMPFAAIGTGNLRAESGSYVDTRSWALNAGFAKEITNRQGKLLFGPVVEYGRGSYDSYLDNGTHGQGDSSYWGVGFMAKQMNHDGLYYEGSLRGGKIKADYQGNVNTLNVDYDSSSNYLAAHLGLGKVSQLSKSNTLDCYAKYFYTRQSGDSVTMHAAGVPDEAYEFDSVSSHRLRLGLRFTHALNQRQDIYAGLAYQYEFDGEARATYNGTSTPSPSIKGSSGMMELGFRTKVSSNMDLDLSVNGWAGKQRGVNAQLGMQWKF